MDVARLQKPQPRSHPNELIQFPSPHNNLDLIHPAPITLQEPSNPKILHNPPHRPRRQLTRFQNRPGKQRPPKISRQHKQIPTPPGVSHLNPRLKIPGEAQELNRAIPLLLPHPHPSKLPRRQLQNHNDLRRVSRLRQLRVEPVDAEVRRPSQED
jgi:hypothetical protein